ncbi:IPT/TIG domain-containing protein [Hymenobacter rubidus]|uniref:IPT/TIG domain-containing protein n=1 Tax=Hymenobacter rubidus TaxID=1441626 RepID=UPI00191DE470|nr:IPT/TIG domain-containing protein [Hymenobacter rubidus]
MHQRFTLVAAFAIELLCGQVWAQSPTITSLSPASGPAGTVVTLTGTNFTGATGVRFGNGGLALGGGGITVVNATTLIAIVPPDAATGPITVSLPTGSGSSAATFMYTPRPSVATRLTPNGPLSACTSPTLTATAVDPSFKAMGIIIGSVQDITLQPDGKVLAAVSAQAYNGNGLFDGIIRFNADGTPDRSFNLGGSGVSSSFSVKCVKLQGDGKILIGGNFTAYNGDPAAPDCLLRLNADGSLDNTFILVAK